MAAGIYAIVNRENGDRYVGSSTTLARRRQAHWSSLRGGYHPNIHLQRAWNKYGEAAFEFVVLEEVAPELLLQVEQVYVDQKAEYNLAAVGRSTLVYRHTEETKQKLSVVGRGHPVSEETKQKIRDGHARRRARLAAEAAV